MNKRLVIFTLITYVVLTSLHRLLDSYYSPQYDWFLLVENSQDLQWYVKDTFDIIGFAIIIRVLHKSAPKSLRFTTGLFYINSLIQLPLYYICYLRYDIIVNFAVIFVILIKIRYDEKRVNTR